MRHVRLGSFPAQPVGELCTGSMPGVYNPDGGVGPVEASTKLATNMNIKLIGCIACVALTIVFTGCVEQASRSAVDAAGADTNASMYAGDPVENGEISFGMYCVSCHGEYGKGDGPVASALTQPPADLTQLTKNNDGVFPADAVYEFVDGRRDVEAHGTRDMPVWGNIWSENRQGEPVPQEVIDVRIGELVEFLRSIQE